MSSRCTRGARLLFRVDPLPRESPRGYLCRVAHEHGYSGPLSLAQIAGCEGPGWSETTTSSRSRMSCVWNLRNGWDCVTGTLAVAIDSINVCSMAADQRR